MAQRLGLGRRHDPGAGIVVEREHRDGGLADGEGRGSDDGRKQALKPLPAFRQLCRDARGPGVNLDADVVRDQAHDALAIGGGERFASVGDTFAESVEP